jgi:hypothetical protein
VDIKMTNEMMTKNNSNYEIIQTEDGKFKRKAKYEMYSSVKASTKEEKIALFNIINGSDENTNGLKDHVGKHIEVQNVIFNTYDKIDEETGKEEYGVLSYLITPDGVPYVTSSKSVYFTLKRIFDIFGSPDSEDWENIVVKIVKKKGLQHEYVDVVMVG